MESGIPLTRTVDSKIRDANRRKAVGACRKYFYDYKHNRKELDLECDEFPFASTLQGANSGYDFSVQPMPRPQNQAGGYALSAWYNTFRILDQDQFYVSVRD